MLAMVRKDKGGGADTLLCESACNNDPVSDEIGVED